MLSVMNRHSITIAMVLALVTMLFTACGSDPGQPSSTATLSVTVVPQTLAAPWSLVGPGDYSFIGAGTQAVTGLETGPYTMTWGRLADWFAPDPLVETILVDAGATLERVGEYRQRSAIEVSPGPGDIAASWRLEGPDQWQSDGVGNDIRTDLEAGLYTLTWQDFPGHDLPEPDTEQHELLEGEVHVFEGLYGVRNGSITIETQPIDLVPHWTLTGPAGGISQGAGSAELTELPPGDYVLEWIDTPGWLTPGPNPGGLTLASGGHLTVEVLFIPTRLEEVVPAGTYMMGGPEDEIGSEVDELPIHRVTLTNDVLFSVTEVTNAQYLALAQWAYDQGLADCDGVSLTDALGSGRELLNMGDEMCEIGFAAGTFFLKNVGWDGLNPENPVALVSWFGAVMYCEWMNIFSGLPRSYDLGWVCNGGNPYGAVGYRLPTEGEWEYACRAGTTTGFSNGEITNGECSDPVLDQAGWYCGNSGGRLRPVAQLLPNPWGLYDLHGNVFEWCNDISGIYSSANQVNPVGQPEGERRVLRGGAAYSQKERAYNCRSANRSEGARSIGERYIGIRVVRTVPGA